MGNNQKTAASPIFGKRGRVMSAATEPCAAVDIEFVARWLVDNGAYAPRPLLPTIWREFRLSTKDAIAAIRRAAQIRKGL